MDSEEAAAANVEDNYRTNKLMKKINCNSAIIFNSSSGSSGERNNNNFSIIKQKNRKNPLLNLITALIIHIFITDLINSVNRLLLLMNENNNNNNNELFRRGETTLTACASWIGELPTAAEVYGDASSEMPSAEAFDDDDEDEELDASATNEYPDNENDNDNDENYEDAEDNQDNAESRRKELWLKYPSSNNNGKNEAQKVGGHAIWSDLEGWRRNKRDIEDRIVLASRRAAQRRRANEIINNNNNGEDADFLVDDGDEDAWVHDGIDDIHIDPETKKAASEMSYDEKSIDAEYEPKEQILNRTRITTIAEVIPMNTLIDSDDQQQQDKESTKIINHYLPASHLSLNQIQTLINNNSPKIRASKRPLSIENENNHYDDDQSKKNYIDNQSQDGAYKRNNADLYERDF